MKYRKIILEKLINKYERSKISKESSTRKITIFLKFDSRQMNDYVCEDSYKYIDEIEFAVSQLEKENLIEVTRKNNRIIKVILNLEKIEVIYKELHRKTKENIYNEYQQLMNIYDKTEETEHFCKYITDRLQHNKTVTKYFEDKEELEDILKVLSHLKKESMVLRNFSAKYLNNSKRLENLKNRFQNIIKDIFERDCTFYEFLDSYHIYKNPTNLYIKGKAIFKIYDTIIDLGKIGGEMILTSQQLDHLEIIDMGKEIVTIENLTTYYTTFSKDKVIIYLGGFHHSIQSHLLKKIYQFSKDKKFIHIGDIDAGGFYILNHLIEDTEIPFDTLYMDIKTLQKYKKYGNTLTTHDKNRLQELKKIKRLEKYYEVFDYMLNNNIKLEQENISYSL